MIIINPVRDGIWVALGKINSYTNIDCAPAGLMNCCYSSDGLASTANRFRPFGAARITSDVSRLTIDSCKFWHLNLGNIISIIRLKQV